jgi:hypothetical protein
VQQHAGGGTGLDQIAVGDLDATARAQLANQVDTFSDRRIERYWTLLGVLNVHIPALPSRGGSDLVERLFAPLGWSVKATAIGLDEQVPSWGKSPYLDLRLSGVMPVAAALTQLYVLMPVLDDSKHYWVSADEVDKLMLAGGSWLVGHPERDLIISRYLGHHRTLVQDAVSRLAEVDDIEAEALDIWVCSRAGGPIDAVGSVAQGCSHRCAAGRGCRDRGRPGLRRGGPAARTCPGPLIQQGPRGGRVVPGPRARGPTAAP